MTYIPDLSLSKSNHYIKSGVNAMTIMTISQLEEYEIKRIICACTGI